MTLTSDQGRTEQTQVMLRGKDISETLFSEEDRERGRERAGVETSPKCLPSWPSCFKQHFTHLGELIHVGDNTTVLN